MAIIYGIADSEQHLLNKYPNRVKSAKDFPQVHQEIKEEIDKMDTKGFFSKIKIWNKKRHLSGISFASCLLCRGKRKKTSSRYR